MAMSMKTALSTSIAGRTLQHQRTPSRRVMRLQPVRAEQSLGDKIEEKTKVSGMSDPHCFLPSFPRGGELVLGCSSLHVDLFLFSSWAVRPFIGQWPAVLSHPPRLEYRGWRCARGVLSRQCRCTARPSDVPFLSQEFVEATKENSGLDLGNLVEP